MYARDSKTGRFLTGNSGNGGRKPGSRGRHSENFLREFANDFEQHGAVIIQQVRREEPAATAFFIGSGLLLVAVEDVRVDGERLEGVGVTPTIEVRAGAASAGSDDPQLSRAVSVLSGS